MKECKKSRDFLQDAPYGKVFQMIANRFKRMGDENLAKHDITFAQLKILAYVSRREEKEEVLQRDLEQSFEVRKSSITAILQNMEKSGIILRESAAEDARIKRILLTDKGKELDRELKSYIHTLEEEIVAGFSEEEKVLFRSFLWRISENLERLERKDLC